jgi:hypothetical protein
MYYQNIHVLEEFSVLIHNWFQGPRFFVYPACDPNNSSNTYNYQEANHNYDGAVTPNFTTYIIIPAQNFHFSEEFEVKVILR